MKRIHLFEFEDFPWFPVWLRACLTRLMMVMHRFLGSADELAALLQKALAHAPKPAIIDLCAGSGGAMIAAFTQLRYQPGNTALHLTLTDLYPDHTLAAQLNADPASPIRYEPASVDATAVPPALTGVRTMVCSFHHMPPATARAILADAAGKRQPICIYEISDNSFPILLWWIALPLNFLIPFFITPFVRPLTVQQVLFTYVLPIIPFFFAWDGAVSNARTYTLADMAQLISGLDQPDYHWEMGRLTGKAKKLYLLGLPV